MPSSGTSGREATRHSAFGDVSARFTTAPPGAPVEVAAPLHVDVTLDLRHPEGGPHVSPYAELQLRDASGAPAVYGSKPAAPISMHVGTQPTEWVADISAPTQPGTYHVHLIVHNGGDTPVDLDLAQPAVTVVRAVPYQGGLVYSRGGNLWRTDAQGGHTHQLTFYAGDGRAQDPAWSPDGSHITFARALPAPSDEIPNTEIWTIDPNGTSPAARVPRRPDEDLVMPMYAPDGSLFFTSDRVIDPATGATPTIDRRTDAQETWSIARVPASGADPRTPVLPEARGGDISADGRYLVYIHVPVAQANSELLVTDSLVLATPDGKTVRELVPPEKFQDVMAPRFSPDGTQIAFAAINPYVPPSGGLNLWQALGLAPRPAHANGVPWDIYLVPAAGGPITRVTHMNADQPFPAWSRDGKRLAVMTERGLFMIDLANPAAAQAIGPASTHGQLAWYDP